MTDNTGINIAQIVYDAWPHGDLLPLDPDRDCRDLAALLSKVKQENIGDGLFTFMVIEIAEGGDGTLPGAVRVLQKARDDLDAVLEALVLITGQDHLENQSEEFG